MKKTIILLTGMLFIVIALTCHIPNNAWGNNNQKVESVKVTGPVTGGMGKMFSATIVDLAAYGYAEEEFFFEGDADSYKLQDNMTMDGKWALAKSNKAYFKSRMIVRRPVDAKKYNGTVIIEWLNVSAGADGDPGFMYNSQEILREGYAWVGVSAQAVGIQGGGFAMMQGVPPLKKYDPERYGSLNHPGDAYSYDIYTRAARVVKGIAGNVDVLGGLKPRFLIAYGESQSAMRLVSYVNGVHPIAGTFNGFFIHSRFSSGTPFDNNMQVFSSMPVHIRDDIEEKVFQFETEGDVFGMTGASGFYTARQADTDRIRTWEVAGTAHADAYILDFNNKPAGQEFSVSAMMPCKDVNEGPQQYVVRTALHALNLWVTKGIEPATGKPLKTDESGKPITDEHGNTVGGIRTPAVDVPIATLKGQRESDGTDMANMMCSMFGQTIPFTPEKLLELYPTHDDYVKKVRDSAQKAREAGFLLNYEETAIVSEAQASSVPYCSYGDIFMKKIRRL